MGGFPNGHFYSPVIDARDLRERADRIWGEGVPEIEGVDLDLEGQCALLERIRGFSGDFDYPIEPFQEGETPVFYDFNGFFDRLDPRMLFCMLRLLEPSRLIEVGSGYSSLLSADVNRRFLNGRMEMVCIDPHPPQFLREGIPGLTRLIPSRVEDVGLDPFLGLEAGDVLFIDSSHVSKTGNDVNFLYLDVLPHLAKGVVIQIHDIFLPCDYPAYWVLDEERSWNEQYLLRALLTFSSGFRVLFGSSCAYHLFPELLESVFESRMGGGSFWIEKIV